MSTPEATTAQTATGIDSSGASNKTPSSSSSTRRMGLLVLLLFCITVLVSTDLTSSWKGEAVVVVVPPVHDAVAASFAPQQQQQQASEEGPTAPPLTPKQSEDNAAVPPPPPTDDGHPEFKDFVVLGETIRMPRERRWEHLLPKENVPEYRMPTNAPSMTCEGQGLRRRAANAPPLTRKIFYVNTYNNETTQLHMKLDELYPVVDYFVLVEGKRTFQFQPKPIYFSFDDPQFAKYHKKIIHHVYDFKEPDGHQWAQEQRARMEGYVAVQHLIKDGDIFFNSDVDETIRREAMQLLHDCDLDRTADFPFAFSLNMYYFNFQWFDGSWRAPIAVIYSPETRNQIHIRAQSYIAHDVQSGGWHFSWFFNVEGLLHKLRTFSHVELNRPPYNDPNYVLQNVCQGRTFWNGKQLQNLVQPNKKAQEYDVMNFVWRNAASGLTEWMLPGNRGAGCQKQER